MNEFFVVVPCILITLHGTQYTTQLETFFTTTLLNI